MNEINSVWERLQGESNLWYSRFEVYRLLGPGRSIEAAFRVCATPPDEEERVAKVREGPRASRHWRNAAEKYEWQVRAEAWDGAERNRLRAQEEDRRFAARQRRLDTIERLQVDATAAIEAANLPQLNALAAREMLGSLRMLLSDMMRAERLEYGEATEIVEEQGPGWTSDDMAGALAEIEEWKKDRKG